MKMTRTGQFRFTGAGWSELWIMWDTRECVWLPVETECV